MAKIRLFLILLPLSITTIAFQNCGRQVSFDDTALFKTEAPSSGEDPETSEDLPDMKVLQACDENADKFFGNRKNVEMAADGSTFDGTDGNLLLIAEGDIDEIANVNGNIRIYSENGGTIQSINNIDGNVILCGMSVINFENNNNNLRVFHGDVTNIIDVNGNIDIYDGDILGNVVNVHGDVDVHPTP